ncbi:MAG: hypothetical protein JW839_11870, partial [Candidatus Lokiarchaeota archaeon]|nr:hypothetical protein [Candidatus Lokiarchaeota archaeon]
ETAKPHGEGPPAAITLGCKSCGTVMVVAHPSVDVVCICSKCKRPFDVIRECRACGSRFALTQDEYHACSPAGRRCPVCMEPDV